MMNTFYSCTELCRTALLTAMFVILILSIYLFIITADGNSGRKKRNICICVFSIFLVMLIFYTDTYMNIVDGMRQHLVINIPVSYLWLLAVSAAAVLVYEYCTFTKQQKDRLSRNSVKEAMDRLPSGIAYFNADGSLKLCNMQMYRLFHILAGKDIQRLPEFDRALESCTDDTPVVCLSWELGKYRFPDGRVWRCRKGTVTDRDGNRYTEVIFSDLTAQHERETELKVQTQRLKEISVKIKKLSDNVQILTHEKEVLNAKTMLHDKMGAGLTACRRVLAQDGKGADTAVDMLSKAVSAIKHERDYIPEKDMMEQLIRDAQTVGVKVVMEGERPESETAEYIFMLAMRECLSNGVRHAGASELYVKFSKDENGESVNISNDGKPPEGEVVPKGGLHNLQLSVYEKGGNMKIISEPHFAVDIWLPAENGDNL